MTDEESNRPLHGALLAAVILLMGVVLVLLGAQMAAEHGGEIVREAGYVVIGTVLVTYCYEYILRRQHDEHILDLVSRSLIADAPRFGLVRIHRRLQFQDLFDRLGPGDELLWLDTYCPDQPSYLPKLRNALERGAQVKLLAIEPTSIAARLRAKEINPERGFSVERFSSEAMGNLEALRDSLASEAPSVRRQVTVRLYDDLPCVPMYIYVHKGRPHTAFNGFFLRNPSFDRPHLEWRAASDGLLLDFFDYFSAKWNKYASSEFDLAPAGRTGEETDLQEASGPQPS